MASTRIQYKSSEGQGQLVREFVRDLIIVREKGNRIRLALEAIAFEQDWAAVEAVFELQPGQGETFYNIIVYGSLAVSGIGDLNRLDQGN